MKGRKVEDDGKREEIRRKLVDNKVEMTAKEHVRFALAGSLNWLSNQHRTSATATRGRCSLFRPR